MKCVVFCSGKGGAGKSCVAAYTGAALAAAGQKTLLLEAGGDFRSLDLILGTEDSVANTIEDVLAGRCEPGEAMLSAGIQEHLQFIPAPLGGCVDPDPGALARLLRTLTGYDYVLVDGVRPEHFPVPLADEFAMVLTPDTLCLRACARVSQELYAAGARMVRLIINNVPAQVQPIIGVQDFDDIIDQVGAPLLGIVPASPKLQYSSNNAKKLDRESLTVKVFDNLAGRLMGQRRPLLIR